MGNNFIQSIMPKITSEICSSQLVSANRSKIKIKKSLKDLPSIYKGIKKPTGKVSLIKTTTISSKILRFKKI